MKKYIVYILLATLLICLMFYMQSGISLWLSTVGTYVVISAVTFFLGWLLGCWAMRNRYKRRIKQLQADHAASLASASETATDSTTTTNSAAAAK